MNAVRARLISGGLALLLVAALAPSIPVASAQVPGSAARASMVADSGFRPSSDGYAFANYVNRRGRPNLGSAELRRLFGDAVCAGFDTGACVLSPPALAWMEQQNDSMASGHCVGLSVTALLFWSKLNDASQFGSAVVPNLNLVGNPGLAREIAYAQVFQMLPSVSGAQVSSSPRDVVQALISGMGREGALYTLGVINAAGGGGHAVTPYAVQRLAQDRYAILVYDNNFPRRTRKVMVNTKANTWSYTAALSPHAPSSHYTGDASTQSLVLLPARPGLGLQPCLFCLPPDAATTAMRTRAAVAATAAPAQARGRRAPLQAIRLQTSGPVGAHLLITDGRGRRIGFVRGRLINEIPGARVVPVFVDGTRTWLERIEPQYEVPSGRRYRIKLTAGGGRGARSKATVTVLEAGFVAAARSIFLAPRQRARLRLSPDGHTISFARARGGREPVLVLGNAAPGAGDYQWNIRNKRRSTGKPVPVSLDVGDRKMSITGGGRYDLKMYALGDGVSVFTHRRVRLGASVTGVLDYENWTDGEAMPLTEFEHGRVIRRRMLSDQASPDTGSQFTPDAATPGSGEPLGAPPNTTIASKPSQVTNSATAAFTFSSGDVASFECKLDRGNFVPCMSPTSYDSLADGSHMFTVRAIDRTGRRDPTPAQFTWIVDSTAPTLAPAISPLPAYIGGSATATPNATDGGTGVASQSCALVSTSSVGDQTILCAATDNAGNTITVVVHYTVQYRILGLFPPAPNSKWKAGQTVPIKFALADAAGAPIADATAAGFAAACNVTFSASGAQTQSPACMTYDDEQFIYEWKLGDALGEVTFEIRVDYGSGTPTTLSQTISVIE